MKLIFLGSGSAFTVGDDNYNSNIILENDEKNRLLIDCGSDARLSLYASGFSHRDITDVYISHLHADHTGGLEWLAFKTKFDPTQSRKPVLHISDQLVDALWENDLSGGLRSLQDVVATLTTYFDVEPIGGERSFTWQSVLFQLVKTEHVYNGEGMLPSYGLFFTVNDINCFITTDTQFKPERYMEYYEKADVIFHDCEILPRPSTVHSHYTQLVTLPPEVRAKIWLYHYDPCPLPDALKDGFKGFVKRGQCFNFDDKESFK